MRLRKAVVEQLIIRAFKIECDRRDSWDWNWVVYKRLHIYFVGIGLHKVDYK